MARGQLDILAYMIADVLPEHASPFGRRVRDRLRDETLIWLTTVGASGTPHPNPIWFLWTGDDVLIYNDHAAKRLASIRERPQVSLHFNSDASGGDVLVLAGTAEADDSVAAADANPEYLDKYGEAMEHVAGSKEAFARKYSVAVRVRITRVRGF